MGFNKKFYVVAGFMVCCMQMSVSQTLTDSCHYANMALFSAQLQVGSIFAHSTDVENTSNAQPKGIDLQYGVRRIQSSTYHRFRQYPKSGLGILVTDFDTPILGFGTMLYGFFSPYFYESPNVAIKLHCAAGPAVLSAPYDATKNPTNRSYSTHLNAFLAVGIENQLRLKKNWNVLLGLHYQHISNGGYKEPNKGINWPVISLGVAYDPYIKHPTYAVDVKIYTKKWSFVASPFIAGRNATSETLNWRWIYGLRTEVAYTKKSIHSWSFGLDVFQDQWLREYLDKAHQNQETSLRVAFTGGHYFLLGNLYFAQHVGIYIYKTPTVYMPVYQRYALGYNINKHVRAALSLLAHLQVANFGSVQVDFIL